MSMEVDLKEKKNKSKKIVARNVYGGWLKRPNIGILNKILNELRNEAQRWARGTQGYIRDSRHLAPNKKIKSENQNWCGDQWFSELKINK